MSVKQIVHYGCFLIALFSCQKDQGFDSVYPLHEQIIITGLSYSADPKQEMDLYLPANRNASTRVAIFIHGGGWTKGDKSDFSFVPMAFVSSGVAAVNLNYRLANVSAGIDYHTILADIETAILFLQARDSIYGCSFDSLTLIGKSAGGHLALMYAYQQNTVSKVVTIATPTDLNDSVFLNTSDIHDRVYQVTGGDDAYQRTLASPVSYTDSVATRLYHGKKDGLVPYQQSVVFYDKIKTLNAENKMILFENAEHEIMGEELNQIISETIQWIKE